MEERRSSRVGTVSGLALLVGGTAVTAVAGGSHSAFSTVLLVLLSLGLGHSLAVEIQRQARRQTTTGWSRHDTINAVLLGVWAESAMLVAILGAGRPPMQAVAVALAGAYAAACAYFVTERRRAVATQLGSVAPHQMPAPAKTGTKAPAHEPVDPH